MASLADLHFELGQRLGACGGISVNGHRYTNADLAESPLAGLQIDAAVRMPRPVEMPDTPSIRKWQAEWDETGRLMSEAYDAYHVHRDPARYRADCSAIIAREDGL